MPLQDSKHARRKRIHYRIRKSIQGSPTRPRVSIFKSNKFIYAQVVDDTTGTTLLSVDSRKLGGKNIAAAQKAGALLAERIKAKGIEAVVFDRSGYLFHGVVKSLCDALAAEGLQPTRTRT